MTCNDCIHNEVCEELEQKNGISKIFTCQCAFFKNKADFVEVVRCEKCKYGDVSCHARTIDGKETIACYCNLKNKVTDVDDYCSSGERRDTE